jgi:hypothetical protein
MAVFDLDADANRLDFRLVLSSVVTLFWRTQLFEEAIDWMRRHGYTIVRLDASGWTTDDDLHRDIAAALDFPDYYGRNLDALNDCMRDVVDYEYGTTREATGLFARVRPLRHLRPEASSDGPDRARHHCRSGPLRHAYRTPDSLPGPEQRPANHLEAGRSYARGVESRGVARRQTSARFGSASASLERASAG